MTAIKIVKLVLCGAIGYLLGFHLAECTKSYGQARQNEQLKLNSNNTVLFRGPMMVDSVQKIQLELAKLQVTRLYKNYPIYLVLDSPGGDIEAGISLIEYAKTVPNLHTVAVFAASMAANTVEALPGKRYITNNGWLMFHRAKGGFEGQFEVGEVESRLNMAKKLVLGLELINSGRFGISLIEYKAKVVNELWMNADDSIQNKAADKIIDIICSQELVDKKVTTVYETMFGTFKVVHSGCPTFRAPLVVETIRELIDTTDKKEKAKKALGFPTTGR